MSDIVERLRSTNALPIIRPTKLEREAADEIERLRKELAATLQASREGWRYADELDQERKRLGANNTKLVGAIDMIRETLLGGAVEDLLLIINGALAEYKAAQKPSDVQAFGTDLWSGIV